MTPRMTRRTFLAGSLAAAVASAGSGAESRRLNSLTDRVDLGRTGLKASYLGFGTGTKGWNKRSNQTKLGTVGFARLFRHAFDQGINYFDLADIYGSHPYFRGAMRTVPRDQYIIQTKVWYKGPETVQQTLDRFLVELKTDYIDVLILHCVSEGPSWATDLKEAMDVMEAAKRKKIIRAHGLSIHGLDTLKSVAEVPWVDLALCRINHNGAKMDAPPSEVVPVLRQIHEAGKAVTGMKILGEGTITEQREESLRYVLGLDCVDAVVIGFESPEEIDDILERGKRILSAA